MGKVDVILNKKWKKWLMAVLTAVAVMVVGNYAIILFTSWAERFTYMKYVPQEIKGLKVNDSLIFQKLSEQGKSLQNQINAQRDSTAIMMSEIRDYMKEAKDDRVLNKTIMKEVLNSNKELQKYLPFLELRGDRQ